MVLLFCYLFYSFHKEEKSKKNSFSGVVGGSSFLLSFCFLPPRRKK